MTGLTTVLFATCPAAITAATGYMAAWLQFKGQRRQAEAPIEQLKLENDEANRRERQTAYHELLNHLGHGNGVLMSLAVHGQLDYSEFGPWSATFDDLANAVALFGTELVRTESMICRES